MDLTTRDKGLLVSSIECEVAKLKRAQNATPNMAIKELLQTDINDLNSLRGLISNMVPSDRKGAK
nr:MAG: hypothetical protein [Microvirus sp.]